ncbi:hypothetical protein [Actinomadura sp. 21ATH]|uniref:hypothetical protein n=1 Tax=Actinomadura sp. 21ATH TaxID=1735444 RepID=UPI0035BFD567
MRRRDDVPRLGPPRAIASYLWALSPVYTLGMGTYMAFLLAAVRLKTLALWTACAVYFVLPMGALVLHGGPYAQPAGATLGAALYWLCVPAATLHTLAIRRRVFTPRQGFPYGNTDGRGLPILRHRTRTIRVPWTAGAERPDEVGP